MESSTACMKKTQMFGGLQNYFELTSSWSKEKGYFRRDQWKHQWRDDHGLLLLVVVGLLLE
jgi:hypothetical protein